jgi:[1-hydroxy-2-(trimethylamino)ethyl]phosphonate dioxygenase
MKSLPQVTVLEEILDAFAARGSCSYFGEAVSTTEHALQAAYFAQAEGAPPALIIASLLHDIGHLIDGVPDDLAEWTRDAHHEAIGSRWLAQRFGPEVWQPVRLHVAAKRYLCAKEPGYLATISPASIVTLKLQGGAMSAAEAAQFESEPFHRDALRIRRCDDRGKIAGLTTPGLADYREMIESLMLAPI